MKKKQVKIRKQLPSYLVQTKIHKDRKKYQRVKKTLEE